MNLPGEYLQDLSTKQPAACTAIWPNYSGYLPKQNHDRSSLFCVYTVCRVSDVSAQCIHTAHGDIWYTEYTIPAVVWLLCNQSKWQWKRLAFHFQSFIVLKKTLINNINDFMQITFILQLHYFLMNEFTFSYKSFDNRKNLF